MQFRTKTEMALIFIWKQNSNEADSDEGNAERNIVQSDFANV